MAHAHTSGAVPPRGNSSTLHSTTVTASTVSAFSPFTTLPLALQKYICAATAASFAEAVTMPLDVMKTRMQLDLTPLQQTTKTTTPNGVPPPVRRGLLATGHHIYTTEGFRRLYLGLAPAMVRQAIVGGIGVGLYPQIKDICVHFQQGLGRNESFLDCVRNFSPTGAAAASAKTPIGVPLAFSTKVIAGAISGIIGQIAAAPMCVVKVRLQADARLPVPRYHGMLDALVKIPRQEGVKALWSGIVPSLQRAAFMYGATISTYDHIKHAIVERWYAGDSRAMDFVTVHVAASSVSGLIASLVSTPFDTIKTRIISQAVIPQKRILGLPTVGASAVATAANLTTNATVNPSGLLYSSTIDCVVKTVRSEGVLAIYKGLVPCYCRLAPWQLTFFVAFEQLSIAMTGQSLR